jgi:tRNA1(Val) A37 N6-methylase TrmN6
MDITKDWLCDKQISLWQPAKGHRVGFDTVMLAGHAPKGAKQIIDLGAGVGGVGLSLAHSNPRAKITLVEKDQDLCALAQRNIVENDLQRRVRAIALDITARAKLWEMKGIAPAQADLVVMNPPFSNPARHRTTPEKAAAHISLGLAPWIKAAQRLLKPSGKLTLIWRADDLYEALSQLQKGFGGITITPLFTKQNKPATRIIITATKGSKAPLQILS